MTLQAKKFLVLSPPFISRTQTSVSSGSPHFPPPLHPRLLLTDCFCLCSKLLAWLLAGIVFLNYQQRNQTQRAGNTYNPNQPDGVLASEVHILIQSDLLQGSSPLTELFFTSEGVIEWRKINEGINKSNHWKALPIESILTAERVLLLVEGRAVSAGMWILTGRYKRRRRGWHWRVQDLQTQFVIILHRLMLTGLSIHSLSSGGHWNSSIQT